jgi:O-antigen ligase
MLRLSTLGIPAGLGRSRLEDLLIQLFCLSLLLIPVGFLTIKSWVTTLSLVAFLLAIALLGMNNKRIKLTKLDALICFTFATPFLADLIAQLLRSELIPPELDASSRLLIFIPVLVVLRTYNVNLSTPFTISVALGLILSLVHIWTQPEYYWGDRWASKPADPNTLGLFCMVMLAHLMSMAAKPTASLRLNLFYLAAIGAGLITLIQSQSRGAWLAMLAILILTLWLDRDNYRRNLIWIVVPALLLVLANLGFKESLSVRAASIPNEITGWIKGSQEANSGAVRLDMVQLSVKLLQNERARLFYGYGDKGYLDAVKVVTNSERELEAAIAMANTPHNELLGKLLKSGLMGGIAAAMLLISPLLILSRKKKAKHTLNPSWTGIPLGTLLASLTMGVFGLAFTASFYAIASAILIADHANHHQNENYYYDQ